MASVPNTRPAPGPLPAGTPPAVAIDPAGFARQLAGIPEELVRIAAATLCGDAGPAPDGETEGDADPATADPADAPSDAAQLAALAPVLQSLPAVVAAPTTTPAPKVEETEVKAPASAATPPAPAPTAKIARVKPEAQAAEIDGDTEAESQDAAAAVDKAAKEAIASAKRMIETALHSAKPALAEAAPKLTHAAARIAASVLQTAREALPSLAPDTAGPIADAAAPSAFVLPVAPAPTQSTSIQPRETAAPAAGPALDLANDAEWLDRLARDIALASGNEGTIRFRLHPQTLGHLRVELSQGDYGTSIRLTADTEQARAILADAQPRLVAEARAQGVRIAETHVDLSGSDRHAGDPRRQDEKSQNPLIRTARDAAAGDDAPERPGRSRSDRYA